MTPTVCAPRVTPAPQAAGRLHGRVAARLALDPKTRDAMFALLAAHFAGVDRSTFDRDLDEKSCAILLEDSDGVLRGFTTLLVYESRVDGTAVSVIYSGDTIVERTWWGSPVLARTWIAAALTAAPAGDPREVYWLLLTSGFRTYRFLPVFFQEFYPRFDAVTPLRQARLLDSLAHERFGHEYDAGAGVVRFARPQVLAPDLIALPEGRMPDRHIAFFVERNAGFVRGDELVCLTRIDERNLTAAGRRMARTPSLER
jgi:hypothetical protein